MNRGTAPSGCVRLLPPKLKKRGDVALDSFGLPYRMIERTDGTITRPGPGSERMGGDLREVLDVKIPLPNSFGQGEVQVHTSAEPAAA